MSSRKRSTGEKGPVLPEDPRAGGPADAEPPGEQAEDAKPSVGPARYRQVLIAILVVGALLRLGVHLDLRAADPLFDTPVLDSRVYLDSAEKIAGGDLLGDRPFFMNPLYPYFLAPLVALGGEDPLLAIRIVQMGLGLLTVLLVAFAVRRLLGPGCALIASGIAAVYPVLLFYEQTLMIATLAVSLNALTLFLLARFVERRTLRSVLLAGVALGFAVLARPNVGLLAVLLPFWFLSLAAPGRRLRFAASRGVVLLAGVAAVILPVTVRNYVVGKDFVPVTSSMGFTLYESNNPAAWKGGWMGSGEFNSLPSDLEKVSVGIAEAAEGRPLKPSEASSYWLRRTLGEFRDHPGPAFGFLGRKLLFFLQSPEYPSSYHYGMHVEASTLLGLIPLSFGLLAPLAILGIVLSLRRRPGGRPFALLFLVYAVGLTLYFPLGHYRLPVLPAVCALASIGILALVRRVRSGDRAALVGAVAVLGAAVFVTNLPGIVEAAGGEWPAEYEDGDKYYPWMQGQLLSAYGHYEAAAACFSTARRRGDSRWPLGMAEMELRRGNCVEATGYFLEVLKLTPDLAPSVSDAAMQILTMGHPREGLSLAEASAWIAPGHPWVHIRLGEVHDASDRRSEAQEAYDEAVRVAPGDPMVLVRIGERHDRFGRHDAALALYEQAERRGLPIWIVAYQAFSLRSMKQNDEAVRRLRRALRRSPEQGEVNLQLALCLLQVRPQPVEEIRRAIRYAAAAGLEIPAELAGF